MANLKKIIYPFVLMFSFGFLFILQSFTHLEFKLISTIALLATIVLVARLEQILPYRKDWNQSPGDHRMDFLFTMILFPLIVGLCQGIIQFMPENLKVLDLTVTPVLVQFLVALIAAEFLFYWLHRLFHESTSLWKIHYRHHSVRRVYWMNAGTFNPIDLFLNFFLYCLPFAFLKTEPIAFEYVLYFSAVTGLMEHANIDFRAGFLNYIFNTAELHRWHHSVVINESQTNYGKALSIFDVLFATLKTSKTDHVTNVGVE